MPDSGRAQSEFLPNGYIEKTEGRVAPRDLVRRAPDEKLREIEKGDRLGGGTSPEESLRTAKVEAFGEDHGAVGYEFACWCEEMSTQVCSETLYEKVNEQGQFSILDDRLREHITTT